MKPLARITTFMLAAAAAAAFTGCGGGAGMPPARDTAALQASTVAVPAPRFRAIVLGSGLIPAKINDAGVVVGTDTNTNRAFIYANGRARDLPLWPGDTVGAAADVNIWSEVVGYSERVLPPPCSPYNGCGKYHAVLYDRGRIVNLGSVPPKRGDPSSDVNTADAINDLGEIAGESGFIRNDAGVDLALFAPGHVRGIFTGGSRVNGLIREINDLGEIVGGQFALGGFYASSPFSYPKVITCSLPLGVDGYIQGINLAGNTISGGVSPQVFCAHGIGRQVPLSFASGINNRNDIIGFPQTGQTAIYAAGRLAPLDRSAAAAARFPVGRYIADGPVQGYAVSVNYSDAMLYTGGRLYDLNDLVAHAPEFRLENAVSINDRREIVGYSLPLRGGSIGYLLVPVDDAH